jgi:RimJ/RimL family protein N-acetyltransferase
LIETPRLFLREWRESDIEPWVAMSADPRVMEFFVEPYRRDEAERIARRFDELLARDGYGWWAIEVKESGTFAGVIALQPVPFEAAFTPAMEVGWRLAFEHWGNGYATEGGAAALDFAFAHLQCDEVVALTAAINRRSRHVMQNLRMTYGPADDFDNPRVPEGHRLRPHVLYRMTASRFHGARA